MCIRDRPAPATASPTWRRACARTPRSPAWWSSCSWPGLTDPPRRPGCRRGPAHPAGRGGAGRGRQPRPGPHPAQLPAVGAGHLADEPLPARSRRRAQAVPVGQARPRPGTGPAAAAADVRDLRLLPPDGRGAPALRSRAPGGIRWSDRREDFRTEVLGLMKAQTVKNVVIVPVGSKGGFVVKQPFPGGDPAEVVECYRTLIRGLLDLTDNLVGTSVVPPEDTVRYDPDDPYLVVAADKGTATFSDVANGIAADYGYWLGDAFASGGSSGYDHKRMGITARGAWESVTRHFR